MKKKSQELAIYQAKNGAIELKFDENKETLIANVNQIADLFGVGKAAISKHLKNIFKDGELEEKQAVSILETTTKHGAIKGRTQVHKVNFYNLDAIISVGYRVNSKQATNFRIWATKTLKQHISQGFTINKNRIKQNHQEFLKAIEDVKNLALGTADKGLEAKDVLELIKSFSYTWFSLDQYDKDKFAIKGTKKSIKITADELWQDLLQLKKDLIAKKEATAIFASEKSKGSLEGILGNVFQSAFGDDVYKTLEEKAAHLLYFIVKNHPFNDGNKRSGAFAFVWFLNKAGLDFEKRISPETLASLTILIAQSDPRDKERVVGVVLLVLGGKVN